MPLEEMTALSAALKYVELGFSIIPLLPNDKRPVFRWERWQKEIPSVDQVMEWFSGNDYNIGIVAGEISNLTVVDCDSPEALEAVWTRGGNDESVPMQFTPSGGRHYLFRFDKEFISRRYSNDLGIDIKTTGGYVVAYPSKIQDRQWKWCDGRRIFDIMPQSISETLKTFLLNFIKEERTHQSKSVMGGLEKALFHGGHLDEDLFHTANALVKGGFSEEETQRVLEIVVQYANENRNGRAPFEDQDIRAKVQSALQRSARKEINLSQQVRDWISVAPGTFDLKDMARDLYIVTENDRKTAWAMIDKMVSEGILEKSGGRRGVYRMKETNFEEMDFDAVEGEPMGIKWPLGIEKLYRCYPGSVAVIAGVMGTGKTTFGLNFCLNNTKQHKVNYLSSELGTLELRDRLALFGYPRDAWQPASFKKVTGNFEDAIEPDTINIVDYLEIFDEFWKMGLFIKNINDRLKNGMALILLQRPHGRTVAYGGEITLAKPRLYLSMDQPFGEDHNIVILKCHNWADSLNNPKGQSRKFKIIRGSKIDPTSDWEREEKDWMMDTGRKR